MLTPERWSRLEDLFTAALCLPARERDAFVIREAGGDAELRADVLGMLAQASAGPRHIDKVIGDMAQLAMPGDDWVGRRIGAYRIVREIGRGGMGLVFEAMRDDDEYRKRVALKIAPWWQDVALLDQRFRLERQILADLDHPNIARFLDGGTDQGLPYVVMEYIDGVPITRHSADRALDLPARIGLFRQVCAAIQTAHQSLVVHRDLKPANILVDEAGAPKLLDFGIAKLLDPLMPGGETTVGPAMWTPDYASPEQVRGRPITTRSDVYQLGLVLYELLTGAKAQVADQSSALALDRSVCEVDPMPPSDRLAASGDHTGARRLRGDLDTIVMTALQKEPDRRYESASALSEDLERYLTNRPVLAQPGTLRYRAGKFLGRHRVAVVLTVLVAASLALAVGATLYEARRAERHFQQVRALANTFVFDVHDRIERLPGSTEARQAIVRTALTYLEGLRADAGSDDGLARELAQAYIKVANVQGNPLQSNLGDTAGALTNLARAEALLTPLAGRGDRVARRELASVAYHVATIRQAGGDVAAATGAFSRATDIGEGLIAEAADDRQALWSLGEVHAARARAANTRRDYPAVTRHSERAMQLAQRLVELDPANAEYQSALSTAHTAMGAGQLAVGSIERAAEAFRAAIAIRERLVDTAPGDGELRRSLMIAYGNLGDVLGFRTGQNLGDVAGAIAVFEKAVALAESASRADAADQRAIFDLGSARLRLGAMLAEDPARKAAGLQQLDAADRLIASLLGREPGNARFAYNALVIGRRIGDELAALGRDTEAARRLEAVRSGAAALAKGPYAANARMQQVLATVRLAALRAAAGDERAEPLADLVAKEIESRAIDTPAVDAQIWADLGRIYQQLAGRGRPDERSRRRAAARAALERSAEAWRSAPLPAALEPRRTRALTAIAADIASLGGERE
jgi:tetratricopeptide (TPR) repeat protein